MRRTRKALFSLLIPLFFLGSTAKAEHMHTWSNWKIVAPASCTYEGVEVRHCTECYEEEAKDIPATGNHDWSEWIINEAGCFTPGSKSRYCKYCNKEETESLPAYGAHAWGEWSIEKEPTCGEKGYKIRYCTRCKNDTFQEVEIPIPSTAKHTWGEWKTLEKADCLNDGEKYRTCTICDKEETQKIPANKNSHNFGKWITTRKSTAFKKGAATRTCYTCSYKQYKYLPLLACAKIETATEKQISRSLNLFFSAAQLYSKSKMQKYIATGKVTTFSNAKTQAAWRKYTKLYLRFKIKSITVSGRKATVKLYCQYPDATAPYSRALTQANNYYYYHPDTSSEKMDSIFNAYIRKYLSKREIKTTTISLSLVKNGTTWKISRYTSALDNIIHGNYSKVIN